MPYGEEWREHRKITYAALNPRAVKAWHRAQEDLAAIMIKDILERSDEFSRHIRLTASRIVLYIGYGVFASDMEDPYIEDNEETMDIIGRAMTPGAFLCDLISILKYSPSWVPFQRQIKKSKEVIDRTVYQPYIDVKDQVERGTASPSLATNLITAGDSDPEIEHRNTWAVSSLYGAGTKTTASTVHTFVLAMALNPAVQKQAQSEIDNVVGTNRMPTISDMPNLPYVRALIKETLRWHPTRIIQSKITCNVVELSTSLVSRAELRRTIAMAIISFQRTPLYSPTYAIIRAISRETPDPENFDPDRFLGSDAPADPFNYAFGVGRRICTGVYLAENSVFAMISGILASFDIAPVAGMTLVPKFTQKHVSSPEPFECSITSRSSGRVELIARRATEVIIGT